MEVATSDRYSDVEARLRRLGFEHDTRENAPLCRWTLGGLTMDIMPTEGATRWLGKPLTERVAGSDLAPALLQSAAEKGHRVFLLGAADGVAAAAAARVQQQYPFLQVAGHYAPPFSALLKMNHDEIRLHVPAAGPTILLVSLGCPKQEKWIAMHHRALGVPVTIGVGATLDFLVGRKKRAPSWMRRTGTEWFYRLAQEPRRLYKRYTGDGYAAASIRNALPGGALPPSFTVWTYYMYPPE